MFRSRLPTAVHDSTQTPKCQCNNPSPKVQLHWCYSLHKWSPSKMLISRQESIYCGKKWRVSTHWKILKIPWTTGSPSHTLSMPRQRKQRLLWHCARYTTKGILNRLPSSLNILFKIYLFQCTVFLHQFLHLFKQVLWPLCKREWNEISLPG